MNLLVQIPISDNLGDFFKYGTQENSLGQLISTVVNLVLTGAILASLFFLLIGAIKWITKGDDKAELESARNQITNAILGLVIAMAAWAIWLLLVKDFIGLNYEAGIDLTNQ